MPKRISIPPRLHSVIALIADHANQLSLLPEAISGIDPGKRSPERIASAFASKAGLSRADANSIITQLLALQNLRSDSSLTPPQLFDALTQSLERDAPPAWQTKYLDKWKQAREAVEKAVDSTNLLNIVYKTSRLIYEHQHVFYDASIITDIRPVFDDSARTVNQLTISHVLEIEFSEDGRTARKFYVALDAVDVAKLKRACERAEAKTVTLKETLKSLMLPVIAPGEIEDE
jgi:hypothetical protein